jgi:hypothetical protein
MMNKVIFIPGWGGGEMGKQAGLFHFHFSHSGAWILPSIDMDDIIGV